MGVERWGENQELQARFFKGANYSESSIDRLYLKLISSSFPLPPTVLCYLSGIILLSVKLPFSFPLCFTSKKYFKKGGKVLVNSEIPQGYCRLGCGCSLRLRMATRGPWPLESSTCSSCWLSHEVCNYLKKAHSKWKKSDRTYRTMWPTGNSTPELPNSLRPAPAARSCSWED